MTKDLSMNALVAGTIAMIVGKIVWDWLAMKKINQTSNHMICRFSDDYRDSIREMKSMHKDEIRILKSIDENIQKMILIFETNTNSEKETLRDIRDYMRGNDQKLERLLSNSVRSRE